MILRFDMNVEQTIILFCPEVNYFRVITKLEYKLVC